MSLRALVSEAGLSLEEILNVSNDEFQEWAKVACKSNVVARASVYNEWRAFRNEQYQGDITSLQALCEQAGATMTEIVTLSSEDFRHLTKVLNVNGITQHTLLFQEKKRLLDSMRGDQRGMMALAAVGPMLDIAATTPKKAEAAAMSAHGEQIVSPEQYQTDTRNDDNSRDLRGMGAVADDSRQQGVGFLNREETALLNQVVTSHDENSLLNDVLMSSHNIDPAGNGQLSLEFVWQLANTQKRAADFIPENQVVFTGRPTMGSRRYIKFVESFRSLFMVSNQEDREVLAGLLVLVAQTRGYRFVRRTTVGELVPTSDAFAKEKTIEILLPPPKLRTTNVMGGCLKYPRGQTKFTAEEDELIKTYVMTSTEQPFTSWARLAERLPQYKSKQIRDRWINHLNPNIDHSAFSPEDVSFD